MNYYILPKNNNTLNLNPEGTDEPAHPYVSYSLLDNYAGINNQISNMLKENDFNNIKHNTYHDLLKIVNPYEYIHTKVPGSKYSVSKLKTKSNYFYDLLEIATNLDIYGNFSRLPINSLHLSKTNEDTIDCQEIFRESMKDINIFYPEINVDYGFGDVKYDMIYYNPDDTTSVLAYINILLVILRYQKYNGNLIFKISNTFHKPFVDILYYLTSLYDKVYITKPCTNNVMSFDKYVVCKNFSHGVMSDMYLKLNYIRMIVFVKKMNNIHVKQIIGSELPYFFKMKIDEINIILGHQQIDHMNLLINLHKNKNKEDKIETIKKTNIQKSISWCDKYKIPYNKFAEKINIFLPIIES